MITNVEGASSASWPAYERDETRRESVEPTTQIAANTPRKSESLKALTQQDFELATRFGPNAVTTKSFDQLGFAKVDRDRFNPTERKAAGNPYDRVLDSLRMAALRRDAAAASAQPAPHVVDATTTAEATAEAVAATPNYAYAPTGSTLGTGPAAPSAPAAEATPEPAVEPEPDPPTGGTTTTGTTEPTGNGNGNGNGKGKGLLGL